MYPSRSVVSDSLGLHGLQHTRLPCPLLSPRVCSNLRPLNWCCHPTISSTVIPFSSCPQSFPASESFPVSWLFASGGQSIGASVSASVLPMNIQDWFPLGWTGLISLLFKGLSKSLLQHHSSKASVLWCSAFFMAQLSHPCMLLLLSQFSRVRLFATPWTAACQASLSITNSRSLLKLTSIESVMPSNHLILCHPLLLPSIFASIRVFSK